MTDYRNRLVWHYTTGLRIHAIVIDRLLKPATACVDPQELKIVCFSTNQIWEHLSSHPCMRGSPSRRRCVVRLGENEKVSYLGFRRPTPRGQRARRSGPLAT